MTDPQIDETKTAAKTLLDKVGELLKKFINKTRIPAVIDLILKPTIKEALDAAPPANENWVRLGLDAKVFGKVPVWVILILPFVMIAVRYGTEALQFFIGFLSQGLMLIPLAILGYFIWKSLKGK